MRVVRLGAARRLVHDRREERRRVRVAVVIPEERREVVPREHRGCGLGLRGRPIRVDGVVEPPLPLTNARQRPQRRAAIAAIHAGRRRGFETCGRRVESSFAQELRAFGEEQRRVREQLRMGAEERIAASAGGGRAGAWGPPHLAIELERFARRRWRAQIGAHEQRGCTRRTVHVRRVERARHEHLRIRVAERRRDAPAAYEGACGPYARRMRDEETIDQRRRIREAAAALVDRGEVGEMVVLELRIRAQ